MRIPNNVLKQKLKNVYFILGSNCGGKTSMARALAEAHDMVHYSADDHYWPHRRLTNEKDQPNMNRPFIDWDEYFSRDPEQQAEWLLKCKDEELPMIILDLITLCEKEDKKIVADIHNAGALIEAIADWDRVIYLYASDDTVRKDFFNREDKLPLLNVIENKTKNPKEALENLLETVSKITDIEREEALRSQFKSHERTSGTDFEKRKAMVEKHFNL